MKKLLPILPWALLAACEPADPGATAPPLPPPAEIAIQASSDDARALADTARLLAGQPPAGEQAGDPAWARHAELMDELWARLEERHLDAMRAWAEAELGAVERPLVYPFSGPDLPSAAQLFPAASAYVLMGLEPVGRIPDLSGLGGDALDAELERLRGGLENLAGSGYFVTTQMERDFAASRLEGVLPVLFLFLARAGHPPEAVRFVDLDDAGGVRRLDAVTDRTAAAVEIELAQGRRLYYFSGDLSNAGLAASPAFAAFLRGLPAFDVYLKSASYLLHMDGFTTLKELLLAEAAAVLQDDSGIPLRDFDRRLWDLRFYGAYTQTLPSYREFYQEDLREVYELGAGVRVLPFAIGYHSEIGDACVIRAKRRGEP